MADKSNKTSEPEQFIDTHREVVEDAVRSGFGIFSGPSHEKDDDSDDKK